MLEEKRGIDECQSHTAGSSPLTPEGIHQRSGMSTQEDKTSRKLEPSACSQSALFA